MEQDIIELNNLFEGYILLLKKFKTIEKAEMNDFYICEDKLREDISNKLIKFKQDFF